MYFDASTLDGDDTISVPDNVAKLTKEFDAAFFSERGIGRFMAFYYSGNTGDRYESGKLKDYETDIIDGKKKVKDVQVNTSRMVGRCGLTVLDGRSQNQMDSLMQWNSSRLQLQKRPSKDRLRE